jgi:hypothetical protein
MSKDDRKGGTNRPLRSLVSKETLLSAFRLCPTAFEAYTAPELVEHISAEYHYAMGERDGMDKVLKELESIRERNEEEA